MDPLTPIIVLKTEVPALEFDLVPSSGKEHPELLPYPSKERRVTVNVCSEYMEYSAPVGVIQTGSDLGILQDENGQPMVFALSGDEDGSRLICLIRVNGGPISWQRFDISPVIPGEGKHINCFSISPGSNGNAYIAASVMNLDETCDVYHAMIDVPNVTWNDDENRISGFEPRDIEWLMAKNNLGKKVITALSVGPSGNDDSYHLIAGSEGHGNTAGTQYTIDTDPQAKDPWSVLPPPETAEKVFQLCAGSNYDGPGVFTLFKRPGKQPLFGCDFELLDGSSLSYGLRTETLGTIHSMCTNANPWGFTDLFIASQKGIAFYSWEHLDREPQVILPDIEFKQVAAAESPGTDENSSQSNFTIFAVSAHDELYFIQGNRSYQSHKAKFESSGFPIRTNVDVISAQYNSQANGSELIYVGNGQDEIRHLWKDPSNSLWNEVDITIAATGDVYTYQAYISTISMTDDFGKTLSGYPFSLSSDFANVLINDRTHVLDAVPTSFVTDTNGKCTIVAHVDSQLGASKYTLSLTQFADPPVELLVEPAQRTIRILGSISSAKDIQDAVSTTGQLVFKDSPASEDDFVVAGIIMTQFPNIINSVSSQTAKQVLHPDTLSRVNRSSEDSSIAWERDVSGKVRQTDLAWTDDNPQAAPHSWLGDVLESAREKLKGVFKFTLKVAFKYIVPYLPPVIFIRIAGKLLKFLLPYVGPVVRWFAGFLGDILGIDINGFLDWLGFLFDMEKTKETQKVLCDIAIASLDTSKRFFTLNKPVFLALIDLVQQRAAKFIKDTRPPVDDAFNTAGNRVLSTALDFLFNNPVLNFIMRYNPISILLEAAWEVLSDMIQVPSMKSLEDIWQRILPKLAKDEFSIIIQLVDDILIKFKAFVNGDISLSELLLDLLGDTFWTIFDALKAIILAAIDMVPDLIGALKELITGVWKFPFVTALWKAFTGEEFTLLNFITLLLAQGMNLYYLIKHDELPFAKNTDGAAFVDYSDQELDMSFLLPGRSRKSQRESEMAHFKGVNGVNSIKGRKSSGIQSHISDTTPPNVWYEKFKKGNVGFGLAARIVNMFSIVIDGVIDLAEWPGGIGADPRFNGLSKPVASLHKTGTKMINFSQRHQGTLRKSGWQVARHVGDISTLLLRLGQLAYLIVACNKDDDVYNEYGDGHNSKASAYASTKLINCLVALAATITRKWADVAANTIFLIGNICDVVIIDIIIEYTFILEGPRSEDEKELFAGSCVECGSIAFGGAGIICHVVAKKGQRNPYILAMMGICNIGDFSCTGAALGISADVIKHYPNMVANT